METLSKTTCISAAEKLFNKDNCAEDGQTRGAEIWIKDAIKLWFDPTKSG